MDWRGIEPINILHEIYVENAPSVESISTAAIQYISPLCADATNKYADKYGDSLASITNHLFCALSLQILLQIYQQLS